MKRFSIGGAKPEAAPPTPNYAWTPAREPSPAADVATPAGQAAIIGAIAGLLYLGIKIKLGAGALVDLLLDALITGLIVALVVFIWRMLWSGQTVHRIEEWSGQDIDGDGEVGLPHAAIRNAASRRTADDMAARTAALARLAHAGHSDVRSVRSRMPNLRDDEYAVLRDALISAGVAHWRGAGHAHGWEVDKGLSLDELLRQVDECIIWSQPPEK